jgi:hypothetical protein
VSVVVVVHDVAHPTVYERIQGIMQDKRTFNSIPSDF